LKVERIDHIHVAVKDLDKAISFFSQILGTNFSNTINVEKYTLKSVISPLGLELIESTSPEGVIAKFIERKGEGVSAISFKVPNLEEAIAELQSKGLRLVGRVEQGRLKEAQFHPKDAFGVMIELCEYEDVHGAAQAALS
jgi:methylmalonyl-CoA/ethylmalonyl-CoA epimerase